jgi:hypothetical protein
MMGNTLMREVPASGTSMQFVARAVSFWLSPAPGANSIARSNRMTTMRTGIASHHSAGLATMPRAAFYATRTDKIAPS